MALRRLVTLVVAFLVVDARSSGRSKYAGGGGGGGSSSTIGHKSGGDGGGPAAAPEPSNGGYGYYSTNIYDVLSFGAKGDGVTDDTHAFLAAWNQACKVESSMVEVPANFVFLVKPLVFSGPCQNNLVFQVDGTIVAPTSAKAWNGTSLLQWIEFARVHGLLLQGSCTGAINGNGPAWWNSSCKAKSPALAQAVRFFGSSNVVVQHLAIVNSPQTHLKFDSCQGVVVNNVTISSPYTSPNTDGIHLQDTRYAAVRSSRVLCCAGDDCVSIQTGCSNIEIFDMMCGPGHGISIGGLGRGGTKACVSDVSVHDVVVHTSQNGVRIKTWQGGSGSVSSVHFHNIAVLNVSNPIVIDQFYCDGRSCHNQTSGVSISDVSYKNIRGTYTQKSNIHFACSDSVPCVGIVVANVELLSARGYDDIPAFCWNSYGEIFSPTVPQVTCLQQGKPKLGQVQSSYDGC
ncbi:hypothetical protein SELMODRAFT_112735 [Selaginella moellendorffii]|uniref:endo-polygalacturonase n=1 Tax=Selaginella moellendorffii TaxID=88036 RepID=D8SAJ1_SELML|nr:hypothetical protein SELMODRAFT_112735 [Selaginella moellendorffii]